MVDVKWLMLLLIIIVLVGIVLEPQKRKEDNSEAVNKTEEKEYDLPINPDEQKEAENDCKILLEKIRAIYEQADKGKSINVVLPDKTITEMMDILKETGQPLIATTLYANMENAEKIEKFIETTEEQKSGEVVMYDLCADGGLNREKFSYDGKNMYIFSTRSTWNEQNEPIIIGSSYTKIKNWEYTDKGWFHYELCVPEYPEVSEVVLGDVLVRVKPISEKYREFSINSILPIAYQGNNLFCSNWDVNQMEALDYNAIYESFYKMKYGKRFDGSRHPNGIPKKEFEELIMTYLPVEENQLQKWAVYDKETQTYAWTRLGCFNYSLNEFWESMPEVTDMSENEDGTITVTIDAVCERIGTDCYMTHKLTVKLAENGFYQYLGNEIMGDGLERMPHYIYRSTNE
ncbi:MAG: DUF6070 family protein [Lachnospiraceae bacterium]|nr:DUF6070 family protein [Lachnospiraceae bacterium]